VKIHGLTVCVNYSDYLAASIGRWAASLASLVVVTSPEDDDTVRLCERYGVTSVPTDIFYRRGASFNKAGAMQYARNWMGSGWNLFFDADVIPPHAWLDRVASVEPEPGNLYGAMRDEIDGSPVRELEMAGYFHLFHSEDPNARKPLQEWKHAGGYDTEFLNRWPADRQIRLPLTLTHQGEARANWFGRGRRDAIKQMDAERRARGGFAHERMP